MKNNHILNSLLEKYKFDSPISDDVRAAIIRSRKEMLIHILKEAGAYSIIMLLLINLQYALGKIGIALTMTKTYITLVIAMAITVGTTTGITIYAFFNNTEQTRSETSIPLSSISTEKQAPAITSVTEPSYQVEIIPFKTAPEHTAVSRGIQSKMLSTLNSGKKNTAIPYSSAKERKTPFVLSGSVSYIDNQYYVTVKLIESDTTHIVSVINRTFENAESIDSISKEIADELKPLLR